MNRFLIYIVTAAAVASPALASSTPQPVSTMKVGEFCMQLNMPPALVARYDALGKEIPQYLPPYRLRKVFSAVDFNTPKEWNLGSGTHSVYFTAPDFPEGKDRVGMWLDLTCNQRLSHYVAAMLNVQGVNPITGYPAASKLEQYRVNGPDGNPLQSERYSPTLGYKVAPQNYLTTSGGRMWLDGWMAEPGVTRQFVFLKDESAGTGVAAQILGDNRSFAITVTFYESKEPRPVPESRSRSAAPRSAAPEIGAGAKIVQNIDVDARQLDSWKTEPSGQITIYVVSMVQLRKIARSPRTVGGSFLDKMKTSTGPVDGWDPLKQ